MDSNFVFSYFPESFVNKAVNEPFIAFLMSKYLGICIDKWKQENPNAFHPDYSADGQFYEFTLASNRSKNNFIQKLQRVTYNSSNVIKDAWNYIQESLESKAKKQYSVDNVSLCVLCLLDFNEDKITENGSMSADLFQAFHSEIYDLIKSDYVDKGSFKNIYIIFPFSDETWWIMDIIKGIVSPIRLTDKEIKSGNYPFYSKNMEYYNFFNNLCSQK